MTLSKKMVIDPKQQADAILALPAVLDLAVFAQKGDRHFEPLGKLPPWCADDPAEQFPMLELFLSDCMPPAESDIWTETNSAGEEVYLRAVTTVVNEQVFLIIKSLPEQLYTYQQLAHNLEILGEQVQRLKLEAERATRAKSEFLATMSHEIRTPLNAVIGMADVLSETQLTPEQQKCVDVSQRNGVGLLTLINDILDLSKVESGKVELEETGMDLREVLDRAIEVIEGRAEAKGLVVKKTFGPRVPYYLIGDPNRLRQVIINLLGNSIKFTEKGSVEVSVERDPEAPEAAGYLRFAIRDTGIGIPPEKLDSVFESFTQADSSTTRKFGGTGLGLAISRQLVELMQGRIWVESTVGVGSTFFFTARLGAQQDQSDRRVETGSQAASAELEKRAAGLRILLADDSDDNRFLILSYLKKTRSLIDIVENGATAVQMFQSKRYDLVLMDIEMPVMDGYAATREMRRIERETAGEPTPILALTAHAFAEMAARGLQAGFTDVLTKPIRKVTLLEALVRYTAPDRVPKPVGETVLMQDGMEDVVPLYLEKRRAEIPLYRQAVSEGNFELIRTLSHKTKGTGTGYGLPILTKLGATLESAARRGNAVEAREKIDELANYLDSVHLEYIK